MSPWGVGLGAEKEEIRPGRRRGGRMRLSIRQRPPLLAHTREPPRESLANICRSLPLEETVQRVLQEKLHSSLSPPVGCMLLFIK